MLKYKIVYSSRTGNTGRLAASIYQGLPGYSRDIEEVTKDTGSEDAETYLVGQIGEVVHRISGIFLRDFPGKGFFCLEPAVPVRTGILTGR